jgi:hypothetical protein
MTMADYNQDGLLDLYLTKGETVTANRLYRNLGGRSFQAATSEEVGDLLLPTYGAASWADYDDDGRPDVFAASRANVNQCQMYHNEGGGRFVAAVNEVTFSGISGTTAGWADYDNDGRMDLCVGALAGTSYIYRNIGGGEFEQASVGLALPRTAAVAWGDYDNDGFLDLMMTCVTNPDRGCALFRTTGTARSRNSPAGPLSRPSPARGMLLGQLV